MTGLFVDDIRAVPPELEFMDWDIARTYSEAIDLLENNYYEVVSLDHDLACFEEVENYDFVHEDGERPCKELTGYDILCWIEQKLVDGFNVVGDIKIHTANPPAFRKMEIAINNMRERGLLDE